MQRPPALSRARGGIDGGASAVAAAAAARARRASAAHRHSRAAFTQPQQQQQQPRRCLGDAAAEASPSTPDAADAAQQPQQPPRAADWAVEIEEALKLVALLPPGVRAALESHPRLYELLEVVMDLGRPALARFPGGDERLSDADVSADDLATAVAQVGAFGGDNRAGIDATLHRISALRNRAGKVVGLTCRVGRAIPGSAELVRDLAVAGASVLFLGRPGVGKTTAIRELSRMLADDLSKRVVIVDTSNEIGGDGDVAHPGIGRARRMQVPDPEQQHRVMIEAVENHMPQVVVIDEIGTEAECAAARTIAQRGVQLVATAHGNALDNLVKNPALSDLLGGIQSVTLGDDEAKRRGVQKSILERAAPPTFDVAVEMLERGRWHVHPDVAAAVDALLAGGSAGGQVRERAPDGTVLTYTMNPSSVTRAGGRGERGSNSNNNTKSALPELPRAGGIGANIAGVGVVDGHDAVENGAAVDALRRPAARPAADAANGGSNGFVRRTEFSYEPQQGERLAPAGAVSVTRRGRAVALGRSSPEGALLRLHAAGLDEERLWEVMTAMALHEKVYLTPTPAGADAVLSVRARLKSSGALRAAARAAGVPIYALKSSSGANLVRAFRTLLGAESSAGGAFGVASLERAGAVLSSAGSVASGSWDGDDASGGGGGAGSFSDGDDADAVAAAVGGAVGGAAAAQQREEADALEEARVAVEQLVLPLRQPVELLPRRGAARAAQEGMLRRYRLDFELVGAGDAERLRVLPRGVSGGDDGEGEAAGGGGAGVMESASVQ